MKPDLSSMTTAEADAWRAGWRAARDAAFLVAVMARAEGEEYQWDGPEGDVIGRWKAEGEAHAAFRIQQTIRAMEPPA
jgi:hypothetical protein